jgi:hypothetical protein
MLRHMHKRLLAAAFWLFAALYAGSMLHGIVGLHELVGPAVGLATAVVIAVGPLAVSPPRVDPIGAMSEVASKPA